MFGETPPPSSYNRLDSPGISFLTFAFRPKVTMKNLLKIVIDLSCPQAVSIHRFANGSEIERNTNGWRNSSGGFLSVKYPSNSLIKWTATCFELSEYLGNGSPLYWLVSTDVLDCALIVSIHEVAIVLVLFTVLQTHHSHRGKYDYLIPKQLCWTG